MRAKVPFSLWVQVFELLSIVSCSGSCLGVQCCRIPLILFNQWPSQVPGNSSTASRLHVVAILVTHHSLQCRMYHSTTLYWSGIAVKGSFANLDLYPAIANSQQIHHPPSCHCHCGYGLLLNLASQTRSLHHSVTVLKHQPWSLGPPLPVLVRHPVSCYRPIVGHQFLLMTSVPQWWSPWSGQLQPLTIADINGTAFVNFLG